jgi:hypothetical protein
MMDKDNRKVEGKYLALVGEVGHLSLDLFFVELVLFLGCNLLILVI